MADSAFLAAVKETNVSILFFVGERVYKLRKHVNLGFVDFTERKARQEDCERELILNRRLAPDVYIGVADVAVNGEAVDHMVVMRRLPMERRLAILARRGGDLREWVTEVAQTMAAFHGRAERSPTISAAATGAAVRVAWDANASESAVFLNSTLDAEIDSELQELARRWLSGRLALFDARIASGRVCDGHGDLQAEDIFCLEDGVRILDCVEFSDQLRFGDVCADVAFLAMDLERLGRTESAKRFIDAYRELTDDQFPESLLHYYIALRAYVRAKLACLRVEQGDEDSRNLARQLHQLALDHLRQAQVTLVLIGGLPGSGKSTVAAEIAAHPGVETHPVRRGAARDFSGATWCLRTGHWALRPRGHERGVCRAPKAGRDSFGDRRKRDSRCLVDRFQASGGRPGARICVQEQHHRNMLFRQP